MTHRRTSTFTASNINDDDALMSSPSPPLSPPSSPAFAAALSSLLPRKHRPRTTLAFLALFALLALSTSLFFLRHELEFDIFQLPLLNLSPEQPLASNPVPPRLHHSAHSSLLHTHPHPYSRPRPVPPSRPQVELTPAQELAALTSFLASLSQNVLPPSVDPARPLDPQLVLDFDPARVGTAELDAMIEDCWTQNPVVLFSKLRSPVSREIKTIIANMYLRPEPTIFDVDQRDDADVLVPLLARLTSEQQAPPSPPPNADSDQNEPNTDDSTHELDFDDDEATRVHSTPHDDFFVPLPILLVGGHPVGPVARIRALAESGALRQMVHDAGAQPDAGRRGAGARAGRG